jgi:predicted TPR repeat methyltransferase
MAIRHLRRGLDLVPGDVMLRRLLARDLSEQGQHEESLALWSALVAENPEDSRSLIGRVQACLAAGTPLDAEPNTAVLLKLAPNDAVYQYYAQLARGDTPNQQPVELTRPMFDSMAEFYDLHMVRGLKYQLPKQVSDQILERNPDKKINVLDLGCGTGLLGVYLGRLDGALVGVDPSMKMIERAARHKVYDRFHTVNLHDALRETPDALYQVIAALDVFIYAGDVSQAIPNSYRVLAAGGMMVFSFETAPEKGPDLLLLPSGRYAHKRSHVEALCKAAGFATVEVRDTALREENRQPVNGFVVTAYKAV